MGRFLAYLPLAVAAAALVGGAPAAAQQAASRRVWIGASGDILLHTRVLATADAHGGFDHVFSGLRDVLSAQEIAFANLETPLSTELLPLRGNPPRLGAPPEAAATLARAGLDVLSVANNHVWDQREQGLDHTLRVVNEAGIVPVGSAPSDELAPGPIVVERDGVRVAFVAWTDHIQGYAGRRNPIVRVALWDRAEARRALEAARARADVVVASMHWGFPYQHAQLIRQREQASYLVENGADVVLGHGPHVLQAVERLASPRGEAIVAYSLGNLVSNQGYLYRRGHREQAERPLREPATRDGVWLRVAIDVQDSGAVRVGELEAVPLWTHNNHWEFERQGTSSAPTPVPSSAAAGEEPDARVLPDVRVLPLSSLPDEALREERRRAIEAVLGPAVRVRL